MDNQSPSDAFQKVAEANEGLHLQYQSGFDSRMANADFDPEGRRIAELERIWYKAKPMQMI